MAGRLVRKFVGICLVFLVIFAVLPIQAEPGAVSPWFLPSSPTLTKIHELPTGDSPATNTANSQTDCRRQKIVTKSGNFVSDMGIPIGQKEESIQACVVDTNYGAVGHGYLMRPDTMLGGKVQKTNGTPFGFTPIQNSDAVLSLESTGWNDGTVKLNVMYDFGQKIITTLVKDNAGTLVYRLRPDALSIPLTGPDGQPLIVDGSTIGFSKNGEWMVADATMYGPVRINITTREVLRLNPDFRYYNSLYPESQSAITSDGRYVFITTGLNNKFLLYDLNSCTVTGANPPRCASRDFRPFLLSQSPELKGGAYIRFSDQNNITFYSGSLNAEKTAYIHTQWALTATGESLTKYGYLALGDSFVSGEGTHSYKAGTDVKDPFNKCHLSLLSYPYLIGSALNLNSYQSVACSGAVMHDMDRYGFSEKDYNDEIAQANGKEDSNNTTEILAAFLPGYRPQRDFVTTYKPGVITISVLGNDIGFSHIVKRCVLTPTCYGNSAERADKVNEINSKFGQLVRTFEGIKREAPPNSRVYAIGYPLLADKNGNCAVNVHANQQELIFFDELVRYLNFVVERAAQKAGIGYADVENALVGSRLCETDDKNIAVNGLTAGNDEFLNIGPVGKESYHPNLKAHRLYRDTILRETNDLTRSAPASPDNSIADPVLSDGSELIDDIAYLSKQRPYNKPVLNEDLAPDVVVKDQLIQTSLDTMKPQSDVKSFLHSEPVLLAQAVTDANGSVNLSLKIPSNTPAGLHTIHIYGASFSGEPLDIYKDVYIAVSENDYDGDGVANEQEKCLAVEPANKDYDQDGTDDACDGQISEPPPVEEAPPIPDDLPDAGPIGLPDFITLPGKESQSAGETVAGDEELSAPASEPVAQTALSANNPATKPLRHGQIIDFAASVAPSDQHRTLGVVIGSTADKPLKSRPMPHVKPTNPANAPKSKPGSAMHYVVAAIFIVVSPILLALTRYKKTER